jgi:hypothetical protein
MNWKSLPSFRLFSPASSFESFALHRNLLNDTLAENIIRQHVILVWFIVASNKKREKLCIEDQILLFLTVNISDKIN